MTDVLAPHIETVDGVCGGKPKIAGKRFAVQHIYVLHERLRLTPEEIANEYDLTLAEIFAALTYAFDHQTEIEKQIREEETEFTQFKTKNSSLLKEKLREYRRKILPG